MRIVGFYDADGYRRYRGGLQCGITCFVVSNVQHYFQLFLRVRRSKRTPLVPKGVWAATYRE